MIRIIAIIYLVICTASLANAEDGTETTVISRLMMRNAATGHYGQVAQNRGSWIFPDVLYVDFGKNNYRELMVGGGRVLYHNQHFGITHEGYFVQTSGSASKDARYFLPWTKAHYKLNSKIGGDVVYFFYAPLNQAGKFHQVIERAKLEYDFGRFKLGGGYAGSGPNGKPWQHKPLATLTLKCGALGNLEFWLQRLPGNHAQGQMRLTKVFK